MERYARRLVLGFASISFCSIIFPSFAAEPFGIIGGNNVDFNTPYAALVSSTGVTSALTGDPFPSAGDVYGVAITSNGNAIIGGDRQIGPDYLLYAAFVSPTGVKTNISFPVISFPDHYIQGVGVTPNNQAIISGTILDYDGPYGAVVSPDGVITTLNGPDVPVSLGQLPAAAINPSGKGIIGGYDHNFGTEYVAFVDTSGVATKLTGFAPTGFSAINAVDIIPDGRAIVGGHSDNGGALYFALVASDGVRSAPTGPGLPVGSGDIYSVSMNDSGSSIIGGEDSNMPYAALVSSTGFTTSLTGPGLPVGNGSINSVAIANSGAAIIGGRDHGNTTPYAALVSSTGVTTALTGPGLPIGNGTIYSVAISSAGYALIGGNHQASTVPYVALVDATGYTVALTGSALPVPNGRIISVALIDMMFQIPTGSLTGNDKEFADYINQNAPQDAIYFLPSAFNGTLSDALQSAAPTRNALSIFAEDLNFFLLNDGLATHLRNHRQFRRSALSQPAMAAANFQGIGEELIAARTTDSNVETAMSFFSRRQEKEQENVLQPAPAPIVSSTALKTRERPRTIWFEALGAFASQKSQNQTVGFDPEAGGFILAVDKMMGEQGLAGFGVAYTFTHISEHESAGYSNIDQEYFFFYGSWSNRGVYIDGAVWGGAFQTHQVRNIQMTGFDFTASSHPKGFQCSPHFGIGYDSIRQKIGPRFVEWVLSPFAMVDWVNNWQGHFKEKGDGPFNADQKAHYSSFLRAEAGLIFREAFAFSRWWLILEEKGSYANQTPFGVGRVVGSLVGSPGSFTLDTLTASQNLGVVKAMAVFQPINGRYPYGSLSYQGEFGSSFQSHQGMAEISWNF